MIYKVGDLVRIKNRIDVHPFNDVLPGFTENMCEYLGRTAKVVWVSEKSQCYFFDIDEGCHRWHESYINSRELKLKKILEK